jgi:uncharacterized cupredoxin-like copper-binding protein
MKKANPLIVVLLLFATATVTASGVQAQTATVNITLYEGEINNGANGAFGNSSSSLSSPGPALEVHVGDVVHITVANVGKLAHSWAIVSDKANVNSVVFNSAVKSGSNPIQPDQSASTTFTADKEGSYYYVCQVPGHVDLGMYGTIKVVAAVPELSPSIVLILLGVVLTSAVVYKYRRNK